LDSLAVPKARAVQAQDFADTTLLEEIRRSGTLDRLYGRSF
jgi:hypothetical protein